MTKYTEAEVQEMLASESTVTRMELAENGIALPTLVNDNSCVVRRVVAREGYGLEVLVHDNSPKVRREVAEQGYGLDVLIHDDIAFVRQEVAEQGYGLETLIGDDSWSVRSAVARQGFGLTTLVHDKDDYVQGIATKLLDASVHVIARNFGTYNGNIYLYVWDDRYEIESGCYRAESLEEWVDRCAHQLGEETASEMGAEIRVILEEYGVAFL